jgi:hypothetical protein
VPRSLETHSFSNASSQALNSGALPVSARTLGTRQASSRITALNIEFVANPKEAHKVHAALPSAIQEALGEVAGFAGSFVMIANHEARLVTVVTLWSGENRMQRCNENVRWVRALLAPYLDRCLRVQMLDAYVPAVPQISHDFEQAFAEGVIPPEAGEEATVCVA